MFDALHYDVSTPEKLVAHVVNEGCPDRLPGIDVDYAARVVAGVTLLDEKLPTWWREDHEHPIDLDVLDVANGHYCVSAQLSGATDGGYSFVIGRDMLGLDDKNYRLSGFSAENYDTLVDALGLAHGEAEELEYDDDEAFALLTTLWTNVIRVRRGEPVDLRA